MAFSILHNDNMGVTMEDVLHLTNCTGVGMWGDAIWFQAANPNEVAYLRGTMFS